MGYELLFKVGDDPLAELAEMDNFYQWSARIRKLESLFEKKSSMNKWLLAAFFALLIASAGVLGVLIYLVFF